MQPIFPSARAAVRALPCPLCPAAAGAPCKSRPPSMHLGRWLFALEAGHVAKSDVAAELARIVIVTKLALIPEGDVPGGPGKGPGSAGFSHVCPVRGCSALVSGTRLMCGRDWDALSYALRAEVWRTWRSGTGSRTPEHRAACARAISAAEAVRA